MNYLNYRITREDATNNENFTIEKFLINYPHLS